MCINCSYKPEEQEYPDEPEERVCPVCNDIFIPKHENEEWCGYSCASGK